MPYGLLVQLIVSVLAIRFVGFTRASRRAKILVTATLLASFVLQFAWPRWALTALLIQAALGISLSMHSMIKTRPRLHGSS